MCIIILKLKKNSNSIIIKSPIFFYSQIFGLYGYFYSQLFGLYG